MKIATSILIQLCVLVNVWITINAFRPASSRVPKVLASNQRMLRINMGLFGNKQTDSAIEIPIQDYKNEWKVIPDMWETLAKTIPDHTMLTDNISPDTGMETNYVQFALLFLPIAPFT